MSNHRGTLALSAFVATILASLSAQGAIATHPPTDTPLSIAQPPPTANAQQAAGVQAPPTIDFSRVALQFEKNEGQSAAAVQFLARGPGYSLFLTADEAVLSLGQAGVAENPGSSPSAKRTAAGSTPASSEATGAATLVRAQLIGARSGTSIDAEDPLPGRSNYLLGNDSSKWHRNVAEYGRVRYRNVYDGIDLVYYGTQQQLEYDFVVAPGTDPDQIRLRYSGIDNASIDEAGDLHLHSGAGEIIEHKPVSYQLRGNVQEPVSGSFRILNTTGHTTEVALAVSGYDKSRSLIIDPILAFSTFLGGPLSGGLARGIAVDATGSTYVIGYTSDSSFPTTTAAYQAQIHGSFNAFVSKLSPDGSSLIYSTYLGGSVFDEGLGIVVDASGAAYVTGLTESPDFPNVPGTIQKHGLKGSQNAFVAKLSSDGSSLIYSTYLGGESTDNGDGIAVDASGAAYVTGHTTSTTFPVTTGALQGANAGGTDAFVSKISADGSTLVYSTFIGSSGSDYGTGIAVDSSTEAFVTGYTDGSDFPTTAGAFQSAQGGVDNAFITKLSANGASLIYSTYLGGSKQDTASAIAIDAAGSAYITGSTTSSNFPTTTGAYQTHPGSSGSSNPGDAFVSKLATTGGSLSYSTYLGGSGQDFATGIVADNSGNVYINGTTSSTDFPVSAGTIQPAQWGFYSTFVTKLLAGGAALGYSTYLGGSSSSYSAGIAIDSSGSIYVDGGVASVDFPTTPGALQSSDASHADSYVAKISNAAIAVTPNVVDFGDIAVNSTSTPINVALKNGTRQTLTLTSVSSSTNVFQTSTTCQTITAGQSCVIGVTFAPTVAGGLATGHLVVNTSAGSLLVSLTGTGVTASAISVSPQKLAFGSHAVGTTSRPQLVTVTNTGSAALHLSGLTISGAGFAKAAKCPASLAVGAQCAVSVTYAPTIVGKQAGTLAIQSGALNGNGIVTLSGQGIAADR